MTLLVSVLGVLLLFALGGWGWTMRVLRQRAEHDLLAAHADTAQARLAQVRAETTQTAATARVQDLTTLLATCQQQVVTATKLHEALRETRLADAARQAVLEADLRTAAQQTLAEAAAKDAELAAFRLSAARVDVRQVFLDLGLDGSQFSDTYDLSATGKLNELLHFVSQRRAHPHPLKTVGDVVAYVAACGEAGV